MTPPIFADLGKSAKDLFNKGYNHGFLKVDSTTKAGEDKNVEFKVASAHNIASGKTTGGLDVKYKVPQYGLTITEKWVTENNLSTVVDIADQFARGLKVTVATTIAPHSGKRAATLKTDYVTPNARFTSDFSLVSKPVINTAAVFQRESFLVGASVSFDTTTNAVTNTHLAFGQATKEYTLHSFVLNSNEFGASLFHKLAPNAEIGAMLGWKIGNNFSNYAVAGKYSPSKDMTLRAKFNQDGVVAGAMSHALSPSLTVNVTAQVPLTDKLDAHKFGLGFEFTN